MRLVPNRKGTIMADHDAFIGRIQRAAPDLAIDRIEVNQEGMVNDVVVINGEIVFRFPKTAWGQRSLAAEVALLEVIRDRVPVPVPHPVVHDETMASYRMIQGEPLTRESVFRMTANDRAAVLGQFGTFLNELHMIPAAALAGVATSDAVRTRDETLSFYDQVQEVIFPLLYQHQRQAVRDLFAPVISGQLELHVDPVLIHGDLAPYHILLDPAAPAIAGVIDFGTAGLGDPATEIATLLVHYGERIVNQMTTTYPISPELSERARFRAGCLELEWALIGVRGNDASMLVAHIGGARDYAPPWLM